MATVAEIARRIAAENASPDDTVAIPTVKPQAKPGWKPSRKMYAAAIAGGLATFVVAGLSRIGVDTDQETVVAGLTALVTVLMGYLIPEKK